MKFRVTRFLAIDCEMDIKLGQEKITAKNPGLVCKVSLINERGEIVLDTLVNYKNSPKKKKRVSKRQKKE